MKSAIIVGGSNGIGLAIATLLLKNNFHVHILDIVEPPIKNKLCTYYYCNLIDYDSELFDNFANNEEIEMLIITAGLGRIAKFEDLDKIEINKVLQINTVAVIKILHAFYTRIKSNQNFYCGIMGSVAGLISSPMFSVYGASKAALCKFVESINIELEADGFENRILNIAPGSIKGTRFNGGENDITILSPLANDIINKILNRETLFIPDENIYANVIARYHDNPHTFGLSSYEYKQQSGRMRETTTKIGYLSGTFDLFHIGHLNLLKRAKEKCDYLIVGVHPNAAHKNKETYISFEERMEIVASIKYVDEVIVSYPEDCDAWNILHYDKLFVGSDYKGTERFLRYEKYFEDKDVEIVYFPYTSSTSSTMIRNNIAKKNEDNTKKEQ